MQAVEDGVAGELLHDAGGAGLEFLGARRGPPVGEIAASVVLAAAVVEAVRHLVADDHADAAEVDGIVGLRVEERRLQDAGGEGDAVDRRAVIGVHGRRRHAPLGLVHRLADLVVIPPRLEGLGLHDVRQEGRAVDLDRAVVLPLVGITHLHAERVQLGDRLGPGGFVHPGEALEVGAQRGAEVGDELEHAGLGRGREILGHVELAQGLPDLAVGGRHHAPPAGLHFLHAGQDGAVKAEILVHERLAQERRHVVHQVPTQVGLPVRHGRRGQLRGERLEKFRVRKIQLGERGRAHRAEKGGPVEGAGDLREVGHGHLVVAGVGIAELDARQRGLRQHGLEPQHRLRADLGSLGVVAKQLQHLGDVGDVLLAELLGLLVVVEIIVAVRQAEAALVKLGDVPVAVLRVRAGKKAEAH